MVFGRLNVIGIAPKNRNSRSLFWFCRCKCGITKAVPSSSLVKGASKSCGCLRKEMNAAKPKAPEGQKAFNKCFGGYRASAKRKGIGFLLNRSEFIALLGMPCHYCGAQPTERNVSVQNHGLPKRDTCVRNGIDRIKNEDGYTLGNSVACCRSCNVAKNDRSFEDFSYWIGMVYRNLSHLTSK